MWGGERGERGEEREERGGERVGGGVGAPQIMKLSKQEVRAMCFRTVGVCRISVWSPVIMGKKSRDVYNGFPITNKRTCWIEGRNFQTTKYDQRPTTNLNYYSSFFP